ncbi:MAG TPA: polysaccharide deacetylase family protein [Saprospiraceae bacterium]|nr:polysaccharide deacetylase family protein [Saprospiraceae bacterium]
MNHPRNLIKPTLAGLLQWMPLENWVKWSGQNLVFPFYHGIYEKTPAFLEGLYAVMTPEQFENHLDALLRHYEPLSPEALVTYLRNGKQRETTGFFLSFDDGLRSCYETIAPILLRKGIPAAFYVNTDFVDNKALFYRYKNVLLYHQWTSKKNKALGSKLADILECPVKELKDRLLNLGFFEEEMRNAVAEALNISFEEFLHENKPYMNWAELKELEQKGFVIGSHGCHHQAYGEMTEQVRRLNTRKSFEILQSRLNLSYRSFSFPFTDDRVPYEFFNWLEREMKIDWSFGTAGLKNDPVPKHLQRIPMEHKRFKTAQQILREEFSYFMVRGLLRKNTVRRA